MTATSALRLAAWTTLHGFRELGSWLDGLWIPKATASLTQSDLSRAHACCQDIEEFVPKPPDQNCFQPRLSGRTASLRQLPCDWPWLLRQPKHTTAKTTLLIDRYPCCWSCAPDCEFPFVAMSDATSSLRVEWRRRQPSATYAECTVIYELCATKC